MFFFVFVTVTGPKPLLVLTVTRAEKSFQRITLPVFLSAATTVFLSFFLLEMADQSNDVYSVDQIKKCKSRDPNGGAQ